MAFEASYIENEKLEITLSGDLDINNVEKFKKEALEKYKNLNKDIILDLEKLDYIDSTGLGALITIFKEVRDKQKTLTVKNSKKNIKKLFIITELDQLFIMED